MPLTNGGLQQCGTSSAYCDPSTCLAAFSTPGSNCAATPADPYIPFIPKIDVYGHAQGGVSCPEAGAPPNSHEPGYYYRCCSAAGHCEPKNNIEEQSLYCGTGCQPGSGDCSTNRIPPRLPAGPLRPQETGRLVDRLLTLSVRVGCAVRVAIFAGLEQPSVGRRIGASRNGGCALEREQLVR